MESFVSDRQISLGQTYMMDTYGADRKNKPVPYRTHFLNVWHVEILSWLLSFFVKILLAFNWSVIAPSSGC